MPDTRRLMVPSYFVAAMLIGLPAFDALMSVAPLRLGDARWRFGAFGLLSNAAMIPALGVFLLLVAATTYSHRSTLRVVGVLSWVVAIGALLMLLLFALDAVQTRASVRPEMALSFRVASLSAAGKLIVDAIAFAIFGAAGWRLGRPERSSKRKGPGAGMLVSSGGTIPPSSRDEVEPQPPAS